MTRTERASVGSFLTTEANAINAAREGNPVETTAKVLFGHLPSEQRRLIGERLVRLAADVFAMD